MANSRLSGETLEQLSALLGGIARMVAGGSQLSDRELRLLLMGADLDSEPDALNELRRWGRLLRELQEEPTAEIRRATVEAFRGRGLLDAPIFLAVEEVTKAALTGQPQRVPNRTELKATPPALEWHDLTPGQRITAELIVEGGPGHIIVESDQMRVTPMQLLKGITRILVEIEPLSSGLLWTSLQLVTAIESLSVPVIANWQIGEEKATEEELVQDAPDPVSLGKLTQLITTSVGPIWAMGVSPNGRYLVVQCDDGGDGLLRYWDILHQRELYRLKLFMRRRDWGVMNFWEVMSAPGNSTAAPDAIPLFSRVPLPIVFSPDGRLLAWRDNDNIVYLWEIGVEQQGWQLRRLEWGPHCVAFSPDSQILATAGMSIPNLELWDTNSKQVAWEVEPDIGSINKIVFSPDGRCLATSGSDYADEQRVHVIRVWDTDTGQEIWRHTLSPSLRIINDTGAPMIKFSDDGHSIGVKCMDTTREQGVELALDVFSQPIPTDAIVAHAWRGQRREHPWEWARPGAPLPERDAQTRAELDQAADRRANICELVVKHRKEGEHDTAIALLSEIINSGATEPSYYFVRGLCYLEKRDYQRALADFDQAIEFGKRDAVGYSQRGQCHFNNGQYDRAAADFTRAAELEPKEADHLAWRGAAFYNSKDHARAIADFNNAIRLSPKTAWYYHWRGLCQRAKGDTVKADADQRRAEELGYTA